MLIRLLGYQILSATAEIQRNFRIMENLDKFDGNYDVGDSVSEEQNALHRPGRTESVYSIFGLQKIQHELVPSFRFLQQ